MKSSPLSCSPHDSPMFPDAAKCHPALAHTRCIEYGVCVYGVCVVCVCGVCVVCVCGMCVYGVCVWCVWCAWCVCVWCVCVCECVLHAQISKCKLVIICIMTFDPHSNP